MNNKDRQLLGFLAIALTAVFAIYLSAIPPREDYIADEALIADLVNVSPAAGDVIPGSVASRAEPYAVTQVFDSEQSCKDATGRVCHLVKCEGDVLAPSENKDIEHAAENACAENEKTGWRSVVPAPDKTAIPDVITPPVELTTE